MKKNTNCGNIKCQTNITPLWRKGWTNKDGKSVKVIKKLKKLCNACGLHYKKGHFCQYCNQVYKESENINNPENPWIACKTCKI
jgi:hypothetical protein